MSENSHYYREERSQRAGEVSRNEVKAQAWRCDAVSELACNQKCFQFLFELFVADGLS